MFLKIIIKRRSLWCKVGIVIAVLLLSITLILNKMINHFGDQLMDMNKDKTHQHIISTIKSDYAFFIRERTLYNKALTVHVSSRDDFTTFDNDSDYEKIIQKDLAQIVPGLGDNGVSVDLIGDEAKQAEEISKKEAFNLFASRKMPYDRRVKDIRHPFCKNIQYNNLPSASVIIVFNNEAWSTLIRTIHSVLNSSPARVLKQIVLVDDASDREELLGKLDYYLRTRLPNKVVLHRLTKRNGLIRARLQGAKVATGDVIVFLDSHCEAGPQWLEPLLQRIKEKRTAVVVPIIDVVEAQTLKYRSMLFSSSSPFQIGGFSWTGHFKWIDVSEGELKRRNSPIAPIWTPTMAGGLFAIETNYFWESGSYDDQMNIWGGENLEMSFRIWQCGGSIEAIPCSRVGHIFRLFHTYSYLGLKDTHGTNTVRAVEVWMDHYKELFYMHRPDLKNIYVGDLTQRKELRKKLKCNSFKWYLKNIYPEKFILNENVKAYGKVRNNATNLCYDTLGQGEKSEYDIGVSICHNRIYSRQLFSLSKDGQIRRDQTCATITWNYVVRMEKCRLKSKKQMWRITKSGQLRNDATELCLDVKELSDGEILKARYCSDSATQIWTWNYYFS